MDENRIVYGLEAVRIGGIYFLKPEVDGMQPARVKVLATDVDSEGYVRYCCAFSGDGDRTVFATSADGFGLEPHINVFAGMLGDYLFDDHETRSAERIIRTHEQKIYGALDALRCYRLAQTPTCLERLRTKLVRLTER